MRYTIHILIAIIATTASAIASPLYQLLPADAAWRLPEVTGVVMSTPTPGSTTWTYDNFTSGTTFRGLLKQPVPLPPGVQHIAFWVQGRDVAVRPIVVDAHGEEFVYATRSQGNGDRFCTTLLIDPYGGRPINNRDIASHSGGDNDGIPEPPLALKGLEIKTGALTSDTVTVDGIAFDLSKQSDVFAQWSLNDRTLKSIVPGAELPFLMASDLCRDSGHFRVLWRAYDLSETRLLWQGEQNLDYDPGHPAAQPADRVRIPVLTPGSYSLKVSVIDRDADAGDIGARRDLAYRLHILRGAQIAPPLPANTRPLGTLIGFNSLKGSRVYLSKEPKVVTVRFWKPDGPGPYTWTYWRRDGSTPQAGLVAPLDFGAQSYVDKPVTLAGWDGVQSPVATFGVQISSGAGSIERAETTFGIAQDMPVNPLQISAAALSRDDVVKKYGNLVTVGNFDHEIYDCGEKDFEDHVDNLRDAGYNCYILRLTWRRLNPLPGVMDFSVLDQRIAYLDKIGMPYLLQINWSFTDQPDWLDVDLMEDQSGDTQVWDAKGVLPTAADTKLRAGIAALIHGLQGRYLADKNLIGYEFLGVGCDWLLPDAPYLGVTVDYSPAARAAFQRYLRDTKGQTLASLNARYGTSYTVFSDVPLPSPNFTPDPDFSPRWRDFMDFKRWFSTDYITFLANTVRAMDQRRAISLYAMGGVWMPLDLCKMQGVYLANGGAEGEHQPIPRFSREYLHGMSDRSESVSCEFGSEIRVDSDIFNMLSMGGLGTSINNFCRAGSKLYTGASGAAQMAYWRKWTAILAELKDSKPAIDDVAIVASPDLLFYDARTIFGDVAWFPEWEQGRKIANEENLRPQWVYEEDLPIALPGKRLAVLLGQYGRIVEAATIQRLVDYVKRGGVLVMDIASGSQIPDPAAKPFALWRALGLPAPDATTASFDANAAKYQAPVIDGAGFWPKDGPIVFDGQPRFDQSLPGGTPLLKDTNGRVVCWQVHVGAGTVIVFPGRLNYPKSAPFLGALYAQLGGRVPVTPSQPEIKTEWLSTQSAHYLVAHRYLGQGYMGDASSDAAIRALGTQSGVIALNVLAPGSYKVECLTDPKTAPFSSTADVLSATGIPFTLHRGETAVWRVSAAR